MTTIAKLLLAGSCALLFVESAWPQSTEKVIFNIGTPEGTQGGLTFDGQGSLYGAVNGGKNPGLVFKARLRPNGMWAHSVLHYFLGGADGAFPNSGIVFDSAGNLYGSTVAGGTNFCFFSNVTETCGTVFELTPTPTGTWTEKQLYNFGAVDGDGENPTSGLISDDAGNLYGTTAFGGSFHGTIFELSPGSDGTWSEKILYRFSGGDDGTGPSG